MSLYDLCTSKIGATADDYDTVLTGMMNVYCKHCGKQIMRISIDNREMYTNHNYVCADCWNSNEDAWTICNGDGIDEYLM